ncbi:MAG: molybdenum cofactor biosynthesis protein MoaE [Mycobacteriales bacterium]
MSADSADADVLVGIRELPLSVEECLAAVTRPQAGGIGLFVGTVRDSDHDRAVACLEYSAHPDAVRQLRELAVRAAADFPVAAVAAVHRVGRLEIGDIAVIVAVSCPHRPEAFAAARWLIDELKATVPIWKRQTYADGEIEWVGCA